MTQENGTKNSSATALLIGFLVCGVLLVGIVAVMNLRQSLSAPTPTPTFAPETPGVTPIEPPKELSDFTLPSSTGEPVSLSDLQGKYALLFFGYTNCPDFCPTTLAEWTQVKTRLGDAAEQMQFVFVSVDSQRDTPEVIERYILRFDPTFIGLSGDDETLTLIAPDYGLYYELHLEQGEHYVVDHSTPSYLIDPQGQLVTMFAYDATVDAVVETIQAEMAGA